MKTSRSLLPALALLLSGSAIFAAPPPVATFTRMPEIQSLKISPDGKLLALTKRSGKLETISVLRYPDLSVSTHLHFGEFMNVERFEWANNTRLLIQPERRFSGYVAYNVPTGEIFGMDANGSKAHRLYGFAAGNMQTGSIMSQRESTRTYARLLDVLPDTPDHVLIQTQDYEKEGGSNSVLRMNVNNGRVARLAGSPVEESDFVTDSKGQVLFVTGLDKKGDVLSYRFKPNDRTWEQIASSKRNEGSIRPLSDTPNPDEFLALDSTSGPTAALVAWNLATQERRVLFRNDYSNVTPANIDPQGFIWLYSYIDHVPEYWYPDPEHPLAKAHQLLRSHYKDANVNFTSETRDMSLAVAQVSAPRIPTVFYLVDVKNLKVLQALPAYPEPKPDDLAPMDPIEVVVRDKMKIRGYLTTPKGSSMKGLPMIVVVHGGPHGVYDDYDYNPEVQLLASRGYAVLQVNFRGSGGRGREFNAAGYGKWGREMQDDITDVVKWAVAYGVADRNRICIYGGSYGAYAALTGLFREPDLFKCAIGTAGVYDLPLLFERGDIRRMDRDVEYLKAAVGTDMDELRRRSPVYNAEKIKAPVMLIHGRLDERAPIEHAHRMRAALQKAGNPPVWISESGEAHGIGSERNRVEVYEQMLAFFAKHLGSAEPAKN